MNVGLVLEGGARRGIFSAGMLDYLAEKEIAFDYVCGVSAGAQTAMDYVSKQPGRSKTVMMPYVEKKVSTSLADKLFCNLNTLVYEYAYNHLPFDFNTYFNSDTVCEIAVTDCATGEAVYFRENKDEQLLLDELRASCSLPILYPPVIIDGKEYIDGSIADSIPFKRAFECGCDKVVVILTKAHGEYATDYSKIRTILSKKYEDTYPILFERMMDRFERYEKQCEELEEYEKANKVVVFRPSKPYVKAFEISKSKMEYAYKSGYEYCDTQFQYLLHFMGERSA